MAQAGLLQLSAGTLDFCLCVVGSAQWVAAELLSLQWVAAGCLWVAAGCLWAAAGSVPHREAAGSLPQRVVAGSLPAVSSPFPASSLLPSLSRSPQGYPCPPILQWDDFPSFCACARSNSSPKHLHPCFLRLHCSCAACPVCLCRSFSAPSVCRNIASIRAQFPAFRAPLLSVCK